ncbi:winged helix-turn-helix domain-containing protein [Limnohabitans sp.]|uniref:winged helix-turn-helix domain-containing protein n=1 Tax=Limnohabitans sp. TaxID=1907725 RepID=UPI00286EBFD0|nr:winged helix-turn-helix domain-containing protein [Limnohabitans sp.]
MLNVALFTVDEHIAEKVRRALSFASATVERLTWQPRMSSAVLQKPRDLIVLHPTHLNREQRNDFERIVQLREATPSIAIVTDKQANDAVHMLDAGVDRFLVQPFDEQHFGAVVRALIRRRQGHVSSVTRYGNLSFDHGLKQLHIQGAAVDLTTREAQVMDVLLRRVGQIISKEEFVQEIDPDNIDLNSSAIEVYIHRLRKKISNDMLPIRNIKRCGYFLKRP